MSIQNKLLIKNAFAQVVGSSIVDKKVIAEFFHPNYQQYVDGVHLDYSGFVEHMEAQKGIISTIVVDFNTIVSEDQVVFTNHEVIVTKNDQSIVKVHVLAEFTVAEGKIIRCDELTRLIQGSAEDRNIGSMTSQF